MPLAHNRCTTRKLSCDTITSKGQKEKFQGKRRDILIEDRKDAEGDVFIPGCTPGEGELTQGSVLSAGRNLEPEKTD